MTLSLPTLKLTTFVQKIAQSKKKKASHTLEMHVSDKIKD